MTMEKIPTKAFRKVRMITGSLFLVFWFGSYMFPQEPFFGYWVILRERLPLLWLLTPPMAAIMVILASLEGGTYLKKEKKSDWNPKEEVKKYLEKKED